MYLDVGVKNRVNCRITDTDGWVLESSLTFLALSCWYDGTGAVVQVQCGRAVMMVWPLPAVWFRILCFQSFSFVL